MNLLEFNKQFPDEQSCKDYLSKLRLSKGITCKQCETETKHWYLKSVEKFKCCVCGSRTNLKSGTMMEQSNLPLQTWFMTIHLMTSIKKSFSCLELQRQLGFTRYETIQNLMRKIRQNMGQRDLNYKLSGEIEIDHGMYEVVKTPVLDILGNPIFEEVFEEEGVNGEVTEKMKLKRGSGSQRQLPVLVMVESRERPQTKGYKVNREMGYVKMVVMDDYKSEGVEYEIRKNIDYDSDIISDNSTSYIGVKDVVRSHTPETMNGHRGVKKLPWVHTVISNSKKQLLGVHHSVRGEYLQTYLDEFCYKLNRRGFETDMFDRLLVSGLVKNSVPLKNERMKFKISKTVVRKRNQEIYKSELFRPEK